MKAPSSLGVAAPRRQPYQLAFRGRGRPTQLARMIELSKMAWSPVLELLGKEIRFEQLDLRPYPFDERLRPLLSPAFEFGGEQSWAGPPTRLGWLTTSDVIRVHDDMISTFGGEYGVLNRGRIDTALDLAFQSPISGHDPFPSVIQKAASLLHSILLYHPFVDGQKRTGISCAFILLGVNGYFMWSRDVGDEVHFAVHVAKGEFEVEQISRWIAARVVPPQLLEDPRVVTSLLPFAEHRTRSCSRCHHQIRLDRYIVKCSNCAASFVATLNAGLFQEHGQNRFFVQAGIKRIGHPTASQRTLDSYLARGGESARRVGRPQSRL
jgi:death on curing protein